MNYFFAIFFTIFLISIGAGSITAKEGAAITYKEVPNKVEHKGRCVGGVLYWNLGHYYDYPSYVTAYNTDGSLMLCKE